MSLRIVWRAALVTLAASRALASRAFGPYSVGPTQVQATASDWPVPETGHRSIPYSSSAPATAYV